MTDFPAPESTRSTVVVEPPITATLVAYALFGIGAVATLISSGLLHPPLLGWLGIIGVVIAYVKRDEARGTWLASHLRWLIRTFWFSLLWLFVGLVLFMTLLGIPIAIAMWAVASIWVVYRVVKGYLAFQKNQPIAGM